MNKRSFIKNNIFLLFLIFPVFVFGQRKPKAMQLQTITVERNDSVFMAQVWYKYKELPKQDCMDCMYSWFYSGKILENQGKFIQSPLHGEFIVRDRNKKMIVYGEYNKGLKAGTWLNWDNNGQLLYSQEWKQGKRDGENVLYSDNKITDRIQYHDDILDGKSIHYLEYPISIVTVYSKGIVTKIDTLGIKKVKIKKEKIKKPSKKEAKLQSENGNETNSKFQFSKCIATFKQKWNSMISKIKSHCKKKDENNS